MYLQKGTQSMETRLHKKNFTRSDIFTYILIDAFFLLLLVQLKKCKKILGLLYLNETFIQDKDNKVKEGAEHSSQETKKFSHLEWQCKPINDRTKNFEKLADPVKVLSFVHKPKINM